VIPFVRTAGKASGSIEHVGKRGNTLSRRSWGSALAIAVLSLNGAPLSGSARASVIPVLTGHIVIVAPSYPARLTVDLNRPISLSSECFHEPLVSVTGSADVVLVELIPKFSSAEGPVIIGRLPGKEGHRSFSNECGKGRASPGRYSLIVLHTPGTATIAITQAGQRGRTVLRPSLRSMARLHVLPEVSPAAASPASASFGMFDTTKVGWASVVGWLHQQLPSANTTAQLCFAPSPMVGTPEALTFGPGCAGNGSSNFVGTSGPDGVFSTGSSYPTSGTVGLGFNYTNAGRVTQAGAIASWVPDES
jgi:hypothetical protein